MLPDDGGHAYTLAPIILTTPRQNGERQATTPGPRLMSCAAPSRHLIPPPMSATVSGTLHGWPLMDTQNTALLKDLLSARRSVRAFSKKPLSLTALEAVLYAGQGRTSTDGKRTAPSAHALHPLSLRVVVRQVEGLVPGVYLYDSPTGKLSRIGDLIDQGTLSSAALGD